MKIPFILTFLLSFGWCLNAQNFSVSAKSGDVELDESMNDMNVKAKADLPLFKKNLSIEFNIGEQKIDKMLKDQISPADIFMILQVAGIIKKDPDLVINTYNTHKSKGWGAIAKELGIKPGSPEFHALKGKGKKGKKHKGGNGNGHGHGKGKGKKE